MLYRTTGDGGSLCSPAGGLASLARAAPPPCPAFGGAPGSPGPRPPRGLAALAPAAPPPGGRLAALRGFPPHPLRRRCLGITNVNKTRIFVELAVHNSTKKCFVELVGLAAPPVRPSPPMAAVPAAAGSPAALLRCSRAPGLTGGRAPSRWPSAAPGWGGSGLVPALNLVIIARAYPLRRSYLSRRAIPAPTWIARPLGPSYPDRGGRRTRRKMVDFIERLCYYRDCKGDPQPSALRCPLSETVGGLSLFLTTPTPSRPPPHEGPGEAQGRGDAPHPPSNRVEVCRVEQSRISPNGDKKGE